VTLDGTIQKDNVVLLGHDGLDHEVIIVMGEKPGTRKREQPGSIESYSH